MWARVIEAMLGCWLAVSPLVFRVDPADCLVWTISLGSGAIVITCTLLSYWTPTRNARIITALVSLGLAGYGRFAESSPGPPELQNFVLVGLLLLMFSLVPNHASQPPRTRREPARS